MIREFKLPDVGEGLTDAVMLTWHVRPGDTVHDGQVVCEIETAKAAVELPIPYDGVVHDLRCEEGDTVGVGTTIIAVAVPAEVPVPVHGPAKREPVLVGYGVVESATGRRARKQEPSESGHRPVTAAAVSTAAVSTAAVSTVAVSAGTRPLAKPPVRKLAKDLGVVLAGITPSGRGGVITREDVHAAAGAGSRPADRGETADEREALGADVLPAVAARETRIPVRGVRKAVAQAMVESAFTAPHVTEFVTVDVTRTMKLVDELKADTELAGLRITPLLLVAKALLAAVGRNPEISASWDETNQEIVRKNYVNLGIAAATPRGLIVPNIKEAHTRTLRQLAEDLGELVSVAREGRTTPAALRGGTVTITNIGTFGIDTGTPILNPGESAILAVGAIGLRPWVHKGRVRARQVTTLALSFDHRLVDGALGSRFLADIAAILEHPKRLIALG